MDDQFSSNDSQIFNLLTGDENRYGNNPSWLGFTISKPWMNTFVYAVTAFASVWLFGYISGLFPYLGHLQGTCTQKGALSSDCSKFGTFGMPYAYLTKGQTIFIDYNLTTRGKNAVYIGVSYQSTPIHLISKTNWTQIELPGSGKGRIVYTVPASGFYDPDVQNNAGREFYFEAYSVNWGATWSNGLGGMPTTEAPVQQMPSIPQVDADRTMPPSSDT
jgi:hypothetical protein